MGAGQGVGSYRLFSVPGVWILSCLEVWTFWGNLAKFMISGVPWSLLGLWLQIGHRVVSKILCSLVCTFIIIVAIIIITSISISFVVLINCLYLSQRVSPSVCFSFPSHWGGRRGMGERLSGAWLPAAGLNHHSHQQRSKARSHSGFPTGFWSV